MTPIFGGSPIETLFYQLLSLLLWSILPPFLLFLGACLCQRFATSSFLYTSRERCLTSILDLRREPKPFTSTTFDLWSSPELRDFYQGWFWISRNVWGTWDTSMSETYIMMLVRLNAYGITEDHSRAEAT